MKNYQQILVRGRNFLVAICTVLVAAGCSQQSPTGTERAATPSGSELRVLGIGEGQNALAKPLYVSEPITVSEGGTIAFTHGLTNSGDAGAILGVSYTTTPEIFKIDPAQPDSPVVLGQLAFKTKSIAVHPQTGLVYYFTKNNINGEYPAAVWDPSTNTNTILPASNTIRPCDKLAFDSNGTLYAVNRDAKDQMYKIDTETGSWELFKVFDEELSAYGDLAIGPNDTFYNVNGYNSKLQILDPVSGAVNTLGKLYIDDLSGVACGSDGQLYLTDEGGKVYLLDPGNVTATLLGDTGINNLEDLGSCYFNMELAYMHTSLQILPNSIDYDTEISISAETTELSGGVAVVFEPHGTVFNPAAILNIEAHGVDFSTIPDPNEIDIYYDNQDTGFWELMPRDAIQIDTIAGTVRVINARLPHFSRYAIGAD